MLVSGGLTLVNRHPPRPLYSHSMHVCPGVISPKGRRSLGMSQREATHLRCVGSSSSQEGLQRSATILRGTGRGGGKSFCLFTFSPVDLDYSTVNGPSAIHGFARNICSRPFPKKHAWQTPCHATGYEPKEVGRNGCSRSTRCPTSCGPTSQSKGRLPGCTRTTSLTQP